MAAKCIFLYLGGVLLVCIEIFIPGGIVGIAGGLMVVTSFWLAYTKVGAVFGGYFLSIGLVVVMICIILSMRVFPRTRASDRLFLRSDESKFKATAEELKSLEGQRGISLTKLRPSGMARIAGKRVSVVSEASFIEEGERVTVLKVEGNRVVVRKTGKG